MAATLFTAVLVWRFTTGRAAITNHKEGSGDPTQIKLTAEGKALGGGSPEGTAAVSVKNDEERKNIEDQILFSQKINSLLPKLNHEMESITRAWCNAGDEGRHKLVCFAEVVGKELGKLPIPPEYVSDIAKIFIHMSQVSSSEKRNYLEKIYWDLVTVLNLGASALEQPFSYLANADSTMISEILLDKNPKMKTLVSLYLPDVLRKKYLAPLSETEKLEILENSFQLKEVPADELAEMSSAIKGQMSGEVNANNVQLDMTFEKILSTFSVFDEMEMLPKVQSPEIINFKQKVFSVAFFHEWPDDKIALVLQKLRTDQIIAYLRFKPELKDRFVSLCLPMTAEVLSDDFNQPDNVSRAEKESLLNDLTKTVQTMIAQKEIDLSEIFSSRDLQNNESDNVVKFKTA